MPPRIWMHCLAQCAAASSPIAPAMRALRSRPRSSGRSLAPRRGGVPGHRGALLHRHQHVGQRVLDRLELADGPAELDPDLGVLRCRLQTPARDPRALGRRQGEEPARARRRRAARTGGAASTVIPGPRSKHPRARVPSRAGSGSTGPAAPASSRSMRHHRDGPSSTAAGTSTSRAVDSPSSGRAVPVSRTAMSSALSPCAPAPPRRDGGGDRAVRQPRQQLGRGAPRPRGRR